MIDTRLRFAADLARAAGELALTFRARPEGLDVSAKGPQDFVTAADLAVERLIRTRVAEAFPADAVLGEEGGLDRSGTHGGLWIIDPIDGTTNYMRGLADWAVSIGYADAKGLALGVIFAPDLGLLATGTRGQAAHLNGKPMRVSQCSALDQSIVTLGYSNREDRARHLARIDRLLEAGCEYRRPGAATIGFLAVARGAVEAYHESHLNLWDAAAGLVLVQAAGGHVQHPPLEAHMTGPAEVLTASRQWPDLERILCV